MIEQSISARSNWPLWKLAMSLDKLEEIEALITYRKGSLKYEKDPKKIKNLRQDILILEDARKIKSRRPELIVTKKFKSKINLQKKDILESTYDCGCRLLSYLRSTDTIIFKEELNNIIEGFDDTFLSKINSLFGEELLATCIVAEILTHYNSKFDEKEIIDFYSLSEPAYFNLRLEIRNWCSDNYWIN